MALDGAWTGRLFDWLAALLRNLCGVVDTVAWLFEQILVEFGYFSRFMIHEWRIFLELFVSYYKVFRVATVP